MTYFATRHELIRRQRRDTIATLAALDAGTLWNPLATEYRALLLRDLDASESELAELEAGAWEED